MLEDLEKEVEILIIPESEEDIKLLESLKEVSKEKVKYTVLEDNEENRRKYKYKGKPAYIFKDFENIQYNGIIEGLEFSIFIDEIREFYKGIEIEKELKEKIEKINKYLEILLFYTPMCPHCPMAIKNSHKIAYFNKNVWVFTINAARLYDLAGKYDIFAVPTFIIQDENGNILEKIEGFITFKKLIDILCSL